MAGAGVAAVNLALSSIRALSEATYDVRKENKRREELIKQLKQLQVHLSSLEPIQRLKTDRMVDAVRGLQQSVTEELQQLQQLRQVPPSGPKLWWRVLTTSIGGTNHATRTVRDAAAAVLVSIGAVQQQKPDALDASNAPLVKQAALDMQLPKHFQPPVDTLARLKALVLREAAAAPAGGPPRVVQLLGMPGMGKSTLALKLALDLEKLALDLEEEGVFNGGVYFLVDDFHKQDDLTEAQRAAFTDKVILNLQQSLLDKLCWPDRSAGVVSPVNLHNRINSIFQNNLSSRSHLMILDDVFDTAIIRQLCFEKMRGVVLVTARERVSTEEHIIHLQPNADTRTAAQLLLEACAGRTIEGMDPGQKGAANELLKVCDGNMLAAHICGSHLREGTAKLWTDLLRDPGPLNAVREPEHYYNLLRKRGTSLGKDILNIKAMWENSMMDDLGAARDVLRVLQLVDINKQPLPGALLLLLLRAAPVGDFTAWSAGQRCDDRFSTVMQRLSNFCLVCVEILDTHKRYYAPRLVDEVVIMAEHRPCSPSSLEETRAVLLHACALLLVFARTSCNVARSNKPQCSIFEHAKSLLHIDFERLDQPLQLKSKDSAIQLCKLASEPSEHVVADLDQRLADLLEDAGAKHPTGWRPYLRQCSEQWSRRDTNSRNMNIRDQTRPRNGRWGGLLGYIWQ